METIWQPVPEFIAQKVKESALCHSRSILLRSEQQYLALGIALRFHALKYTLPIIQHLGCGLYLKAGVVLHLALPAMLRCVDSVVHSLQSITFSYTLAVRRRRHIQIAQRGIPDHDMALLAVLKPYLAGVSYSKSKRVPVDLQIPAHTRGLGDLVSKGAVALKHTGLRLLTTQTSRFPDCFSHDIHLERCSELTLGCNC